jgi:hypothetical protein
MIIRYDSTAALAADYVKQNAKAASIHHGGWDQGNSWYGGESLEASLRFAQSGDIRLVDKAEALLDKLDTTIETNRKVWEPAPAGAYVCVPDVLAGRPTPMRRLTHQQDEMSPITILAVSTSSAGISADTLQRRGTVILALVMALSRVRPVSLQQLTIVDGKHEGETVITSEINTAPLDLATACYVLTSAGFARRLTYGLAAAHNKFRGGWPANFNYGSPHRYYEILKGRLVSDPSRCLVIGAAQLGDEMLSDPVRWINKQIARFTAEQDEVNV